ncbi:hypothetical protein GEMRC1_008236 [Eukaryota sp. GEM-RC1]
MRLSCDDYIVSSSECFTIHSKSCKTTISLVSDHLWYFWYNSHRGSSYELVLHDLHSDQLDLSVASPTLLLSNTTLLFSANDAELSVCFSSITYSSHFSLIHSSLNYDVGFVWINSSTLPSDSTYDLTIPLSTASTVSISFLAAGSLDVSINHNDASRNVKPGISTISLDSTFTLLLSSYSSTLPPFFLLQWSPTPSSKSVWISWLLFFILTLPFLFVILYVVRHLFSKHQEAESVITQRSSLPSPPPLPLYYQPSSDQTSSDTTTLQPLPSLSVGSMADLQFSPMSAPGDLTLPIPPHRRAWSTLPTLSAVSHPLSKSQLSYISSPIDFEGLLAKKAQQVVPEELICPISLEVPSSPVILNDGYIYERKLIEEWLDKCDISPMTGLPMSDINMVTSWPVRNLCREWREKLAVKKEL